MILICPLSTTRKNAEGQFGWTEEELSRKMPAAPSSSAAVSSTPSNNAGAVATAWNNDTPAYVVSTRTHLGQHRRNNRASMSKAERKRTAKSSPNSLGLTMQHLSTNYERRRRWTRQHGHRTCWSLPRIWRIATGVIEYDSERYEGHRDWTMSTC